MVEKSEVTPVLEGNNTLAVETAVGLFTITFDQEKLLADVTQAAAEQHIALKPEIVEALQVVQNNSQFLRLFYNAEPEGEKFIWKVTSKSIERAHPVGTGLLSLAKGFTSWNLHRPLVYLNTERLVRKVVGKNKEMGKSEEDLLAAEIRDELEREWLHQREHLLRLIDVKTRVIDWGSQGSIRLLNYLLVQNFAKYSIIMTVNSFVDHHYSWYGVVVVTFGITQLMNLVSSKFMPGERAAKKAEKGDASSPHLFDVRLE